MADGNSALVLTAQTLLKDGPVGNLSRGDTYQKFLDDTFGSGKTLRTVTTSCALFVGACLIAAGIQAKRRAPTVRAITTWLNVGWFQKPEWISRAEIESGAVKLEPGDVPYWCGGTDKTWQQATNGHVGILLEKQGADDNLWKTAEGGGGPDGTLCRLSAGFKDINTSSGRPLRGVWRFPAPGAVQLPILTPETPKVDDPDLITYTAKHVRAWQTAIGVKPDGKFGPGTLAKSLAILSESKS